MRLQTSIMMSSSCKTKTSSTLNCIYDLRIFTIMRSQLLSAALYQTDSCTSDMPKYSFKALPLMRWKKNKKSILLQSHTSKNRNRCVSVCVRTSRISSGPSWRPWLHCPTGKFHRPCGSGKTTSGLWTPGARHTLQNKHRHAENKEVFSCVR